MLVYINDDESGQNNMNNECAYLFERNCCQICSITLHQVKRHEQVATIIIENRYLSIAECYEL